MISRDDWTRELETRREAIREVLAGAACDAGLVYGTDAHAEHFRYLTNFAPVLGDMWAIVGRDSIECVLNFTWQLEEARRRSGLESWQGAFVAAPLVAERLAALSPARVGVATLAQLPAGDHELLRARVPGVELVELGPEVAALRRTKSELEVRLLREAARVTDMALEEVRAQLRPGVSEREIAAQIEYVFGTNGARSAFFPCVIAGVDDPIPIRLPTDRRLERGDSVMLDIGAEVEGYQADASRTYVLGTPTAEQKRAWDVVRRAYDAALAVTRPGVPCVELDRAARAVIEEAGYAVAHRVGHGIGLATSFEWPSLDSEEAPLEPGVTICIEPGVYVPGAGNVKLEDDVLITDDGHELLTRSDRSLEVA